MRRKTTEDQNNAKIINLLLTYWDSLFFAKPQNAYAFLANPKNQAQLDFTFEMSFTAFLPLYQQAREIQKKMILENVISKEDLQAQLLDLFTTLKQGISSAVKDKDPEMLDKTALHFENITEKLLTLFNVQNHLNSEISKVFNLENILNLLVKDARVFPHIEFLFSQLMQDYRRTIITMPPQHGKTTTILAYIFHEMVSKPSTRVAYISYSYSSTQNRILPLVYAFERANLHDPTLWKKEVHRLKNGSVLFSTSVDGTLTGEHLDLIIIDDPHKNYIEAISKAKRDAVFQFYSNVVVTRGFENLKVVVIGTRWHKEDLIGRILSTEEVNYIELKGLAELDDPLGRKPGQPLCEFFASYNHLKKIKDLFPDVFETQYQCNPRSQVDALFTEEPQFYSELPSDYIISIGVDLAYTQKKTSDYTAVVVLAIEPTTQNYYLIEALRWREKIDKTLQRLQLIYDKYKVPLNVESGGSQTAIVDLLRKNNIPVRPITPVADKITRALNFANAWNTRRFLLRENTSVVLQEYISEVKNFTGQGDLHDDFVDATAYAMMTVTTSISFV